jgi:hypothetical protein
LEHLKVLNLLYEALLQSNVTVAFAEEGISFLQSILAAHMDLVPYGIEFLSDQEDNFYLRLHRDVRKKFAEFAIELLKTYPDRIRIVVRDLDRLDKQELFDPDIWAVYSQLLESFASSSQLQDLSDLFDHFVTAANDLTALKCGSLALKVAKAAKRDDLSSKWTNQFISLVQQTFSLILTGLSPTDVTVLEDKLKYAQSFVQTTGIKIPENPEIIAILPTLQESSPILGGLISELFKS